jgi:hypothetical protein
MPLSLRHKFNRLPKRLPVGTTFVIEGRTVAGDDDNDRQFQVFSRFVVLPGGRRIDLGPVSGGSSRVRRTRSRTNPATAAFERVKKNSYRGRNNPSPVPLTVRRRAKPPSPSPSITRRRTPAAFSSRGSSLWEAVTGSVRVGCQGMIAVGTMRHHVHSRPTTRSSR